MSEPGERKRSTENLNDYRLSEQNDNYNTAIFLFFSFFLQDWTQRKEEEEREKESRSHVEKSKKGQELRRVMENKSQQDRMCLEDIGDIL